MSLSFQSLVNFPEGRRSGFAGRAFRFLGRQREKAIHWLTDPPRMPAERHPQDDFLQQQGWHRYWQR